jgi:hypothetical protein
MRPGREHCPHGGKACGPDAPRDRHPSLIALTPEARRHVRALYAHYEERDWPEAARDLRNALTAAWEENHHFAGGWPAHATALAAACPTGQGMAQVRALLDWLPDPTHTAIVAVFFETANIPGRV